MWELLKKRSLSNNIPEEYLYLFIEDRFYSILKNDKYSSYQEKVDDYFYREWKEISYFFLFDSKKQSILDEEIKQTRDEDRKFELFLVSIWCSYNLSDVRKYSEVITEDVVYENKTIFHSKEKIQIYKKIVFNKDNGNIIYTEFWNRKTTLKKQDSLSLFNETKNEIIKNWLWEFYNINDEKLIISVVNGWKLELYEKMLNSPNIKTLSRRESYWKEVNTNITIENEKYIIYLTVNGSVINSNLKYRNNNKKEFKIKLHKDEKSRVENSNVKYIVLNWKKNYSFILGKKNIKNYLQFNEKIINNPDITDYDKEFLKRIFIRSLPIKWVTISWLKDIWSNTVPPFFNITSKTFREKIKNWILTRDIKDLMDFNNDWLTTRVNLSKLEKLINDSIENEIFPTIKTRIRDRLYSNSVLTKEKVDE